MKLQDQVTSLDKDLEEHFKPSKLPQRGKAKYTTKEVEWFLDYLKRKRKERGVE